MTTGFERAVDRHVRRILLAFGEEVRRLREDAGLSRAELARAAGVDASYLGDIEEGRARPSVLICARLSIALGTDLTLRAYPTTGPAVRDRHQAAIVESMLGLIHPRWRAFPEVAVRHPSRGWIDLGLHDPGAPAFVAIEVQSELRRLEQLLRWSEAKAAALPSWEGWGRLGDAPAVSRLLVVRDTRTNRAIAADHRRLLRAALPADPVEALLSIHAVAPWPGPSVLWAARDRTAARAYRLVANRSRSGPESGRRRYGCAACSLGCQPRIRAGMAPRWVGNQRRGDSDAGPARPLVMSWVGNPERRVPDWKSWVGNPAPAGVSADRAKCTDG